jgi:hypothetical protein
MPCFAAAQLWLFSALMVEAHTQQLDPHLLSPPLMLPLRDFVLTHRPHSNHKGLV